MAQGETSELNVTWGNDGTPREYPESSERLYGPPQFLTSPRYNRQENYIRFRISGKRPLTVEVYRNGYLISNFAYRKQGSVLFLNNDSRLRCGKYEVHVTNRNGTAIRRFEIQRGQYY